MIYDDSLTSSDAISIPLYWSSYTGLPAQGPQKLAVLTAMPLTSHLMLKLKFPFHRDSAASLYEVTSPSIIFYIGPFKAHVIVCGLFSLFLSLLEASWGHVLLNFLFLAYPF